MRKIKVRTNIKTGGVILIYSVMLSLLIVFSIYTLLINSAIDKPSDFPQIIFAPTESTIKSSMQTGNFIVNSSDAVSFGSISSYFKTQYSKLMLIITTIIALTIFFASFFLFATLKKIQNKDMSRITKKLNFMDEEDNLVNMDPMLVAAMKNIKKRFESNMEDYKRLSSYINHEQKNILKLLRAKFFEF